MDFCIPKVPDSCQRNSIGGIKMASTTLVQSETKAVVAAVTRLGQWRYTRQGRESLPTTQFRKSIPLKISLAVPSIHRDVMEGFPI